MGEKEALIKALRKEYYKKSFFEFFKVCCKILEPSTNWDFNFHHKYLCDILQNECYRIKEKESRTNDWIINVPFRSGKSLIVSIIFPVWCWIVNPHLKIMTISYSESLAVKQAYLSRILMRSEFFREYFPEIKLMPDSNAKGEYTNVYGGTRQSYGFGGAITGSGADIIICDDPNKVNESKKELESSNQTFDEVIFNRLNNPEVGVRFVIQQRINQNDLSGHLTTKEGNEWKTICIPAELGTNLQPTELVEHYQDGLFWKKRFSRAILKQYHVSLGSRGYNSQLNQKTANEEGNIIKEKWFKIIEYNSAVHDTIQWEMFIDPAFTAKQSNDPTGILICGALNNTLIVKKAMAVYLEFPELIKKLIELANTYKIRRILVEPKASGLSIVQQLRSTTKLNVVELPSPKDDKESRLNAVSPIIESLRIHLLDDSLINGWIKDFIDEVTNFPLASHDDLTDCLVMAIEKLLIRKKVNLI